MWNYGRTGKAVWTRKNGIRYDEGTEGADGRTAVRRECSCVVRNGDEVRIFRERGVKDLYRLLREEPQLLDRAFVADKVVGKGAAALMILGGVEELFADVVSRAALDLLTAAGKAVAYTVAVPHIVNRAGDGICPWSGSAPRRRRPRSVCR